VLQVNASTDNLLPFDYISYSFQSEVNNFVIGQVTGIIQVSNAAVFNAAANNRPRNRSSHRAESVVGLPS
jgi:hypothetical protein